MLFLILFFLSSCGQEKSHTEIILLSGQSESNLSLYFDKMQNFESKVFYERGHEPYVGTRINGKAYWDFFARNISTLLRLEERSISFSYPKTLSDMTELRAINKDSWTTQELILKFSELPVIKNTEALGAVNILFVGGLFKNNDGELQNGVLGIYISDTNNIVIFKDVVKEIEETQGIRVARFSEQSLLVHEVGHAMGLVENGVPARSDHHDKEHGSHCTNQDCVMHWLNEGATDMSNYVRRLILTGDENLFGQHCLEDAAQKIQSYQ